MEDIKRVLDTAPERLGLDAENIAGKCQYIREKFDELGGILKALDSPRLKICLDTQRSFSAGYDMANSEGLPAIPD